MDWPLTGAVAGTVCLAGATTAWVYFLYQSSPDVHVVAHAPVVQAWTEPVGETRPKENTNLYVFPSDAARPPSPSVQTWAQPVDEGKAKESAGQYVLSSDYAPPMSPSVQVRREPVEGSKIQTSTNQYPTYEAMAKRPLPSDHPKPAAPSVAMLPPPHPQSVQEWKAVPTARANSFNLGGHIDQAGVVDSMASPYLRDAFKKVPSYNKLPPAAKLLIEAPNINLSKLAPYRSLLGIDDAKIELDQGVKFVRVGSTRGIDDTDLDQAADVVVLPGADLLVLPPIPLSNSASPG